MTSSNPSSQNFESFVPVYDTVPEKWDDARPFLVEQLREITTAVNIREIGWYLDTELLSGKAFIPGVIPRGNRQATQYRQILRQVYLTGPLVPGANLVAHGILFDANFTLIDMWCAATDLTTHTAEIITDKNVVMDATNVTITSPQAFNFGTLIIEYLLEQ